MYNKDYFKDIYSDFFKSNDTSKDSNIELVEDIDDINYLFDRVDLLYIDNDSKELFKKIIDYMYKFNKNIESVYVPFNIVLEVNNDSIRDKICDILYKASVSYKYIDNNKKINYSLYDKVDGIDYSDYGFVSFSDIKGIFLEDDKNKKKFFYKLENILGSNNKNILLLCGTLDDIDSFFLGNENIRNKYFGFVIRGINPDKLDIYQYIISNININDDLKVKVLDYISNTYRDDVDYVSYRNDLIRYISFNKDVPKLSDNKSIDEIFSSLNELVGLDKVKKVLYDLVDVIELKKKVGDSVSINNMNMHMVFLGNPGTGKTTVARIVGDILYNLGYIKENKLIEVSSGDLVAEYVGQTAPKTMSVIEKSLNGILFIDEAYSLSSDGNNSYNAEAIATLIQAMENYRDRLVVIFAGYTKEMQSFLNSNSGIVSRIGYTLEFSDYTTSELIKIFNGMMNKSGFSVRDDAIEYLEEIINKYRNMNNFGNARFVRNIYEKTIIKHASNTRNKKGKKILKMITRDDISIDNLILEER